MTANPSPDFEYQYERDARRRGCRPSLPAHDRRVPAALGYARHEAYVLALVVLNDVTLGGQRTYGDGVGVWMQQRAEGQGRLSAWSQLPLN